MQKTYQFKNVCKDDVM